MNRFLSDRYEAVIGLEVHIQLLTESKIFSNDANSYGDPPNSNISVISLGHPGVLPKLNRKTLEHAIKMGLACGSEITKEQIFDRKNYFYPDLPKGYQITQDKTPICKGGKIKFRLSNSTEREIRLNRIHLEEDAGKSLHKSGDVSLVDLNRAGVPLIEMVTEPELHTAEEAYALLSEIRRMVLYLGICDGNMEEGSLRCDANISVRQYGEKKLGRKVEVKNMNSFRNVSRAIEYEIERQIQVIEEGGEIISETRTFNAESCTTSGMRTKEELNDYRYFPDPDLSPVRISEEWIRDISQSLPELPWELYNKLKSEFKLPEYDALFFIETKEIAVYFLEACEYTTHYKALSNWMMRQVKEYLNETGQSITAYPVRPQQLAAIVNLIEKGTVNYSIASKEIYPAVLRNPDLEPIKYVKEKNLLLNCDSSDLQCIIDEIISLYPEKVEEYNRGRKNLIGLFMGEVMKRTEGKVDPKFAQKMIRISLEERN